MSETAANELKAFYCDWDEIGVPANARQGWMGGCGHHVLANECQLWERPDWDWREILAGRHEAMFQMFNLGAMGSPIEQTMAGWLIWLDDAFFGLVDVCHEPWFEDGYKFRPDEYALSVQPQVPVGKYTVDFMVLIHGRNGTRKFAIECDGHDFHDKTKEQAARDKKRDRDLLLAGVSVMRFTGSEIFRDARACFLQVQEAVQNAASEVL